MELDVTFSTGLNELPALVGNEGVGQLRTQWPLLLLKIPPIPITFLGDLMRLILKENSLKFND